MRSEVLNSLKPLAITSVYECLIPATTAMLFVFVTAHLGNLRRTITRGRDDEASIKYEERDVQINTSLTFIIIMAVFCVLILIVDTLYSTDTS